MSDSQADSKLFEGVIRDLLGQGLSVRFQARGASMSPAIRDGEFVQVTPVIVSKLRKDDIVLAKGRHGFRLHRIVRADAARDEFVTRGDCGQRDDPMLSGAQILGLARAKDVRIGRKIVQARFKSVRGWALRCAARGQYLAGKAMRRPGIGLSVLALLFFIGFNAALVSAQVAVDSVSSGSATLNGTDATLTFAHATAGTNRLMLVGVSINITNGPTASVTSVTWAGTALTKLGAHNDAANTRRVEMWYLLNPATSAGANVVVTVNTTSVQEGVVAGATTFTGVDQTVPLGSFVSSDGAN